MMNIMVARELSYELGSPSYGDLKQLGSPSYGDLKLAKWKMKIKKMALILQAWFMDNRYFGCDKEWYHFQQELMVSKTVV